MKDKEHDKNSISTPECKICGAPIPEKRDTSGPFCSHRCRLNDLSKWFGEGYRIPSTAVNSHGSSNDPESEQ